MLMRFHLRVCTRQNRDAVKNMVSQLVLIIIFVAISLVCVILRVYAKLSARWCKSHTCMTGKTTIITGANSGIGYHTALEFAKRGARVILACRDEKRAKHAQVRIIAETGNENVVIKLVNLASFNSVRAFAKEINETEDRLDILVHNAAGGIVGDVRTEDGHDWIMQVNYFSCFLLTHLLIGLMKKTKQSRVVNVSSILAKFAYNFDLKNIDTIKFPGIWSDYMLSKLSVILFTIELALRLEGTEVTTYSLHPGAVKTEIFRYFSEGFIKFCIDIGKILYFKTSEEGAQTTIYCAVAKGIEKYSGGHFVECQRVETYKTAAVPGLPQKLWELKPEEIVI